MAFLDMSPHSIGIYIMIENHFLDGAGKEFPDVRPIELPVPGNINTHNPPALIEANHGRGADRGSFRFTRCLAHRPQVELRIRLT